MLRSFSVLGSRREIKWIVPVAKEGGSPQVTRKCGRKFPCMGGPCGALGQAYWEWREGPLTLRRTWRVSGVKSLESVGELGSTAQPGFLEEPLGGTRSPTSDRSASCLTP